MSEVILSADGRPETSISAHGWVNKLNSPRVFFKGTGLLPLQTPDGLQGRRQRELDIIKVCLPLKSMLARSQSSACLATAIRTSSRLLNRLTIEFQLARLICAQRAAQRALWLGCDAGRLKSPAG